MKKINTHDRTRIFHLHKSENMTLPQLKFSLEQSAWEIQRLLSSADLYRQTMPLTFRRLSKDLVKAHKAYHQARIQKIML